MMQQVAPLEIHDLTNELAQLVRSCSADIARVRQIEVRVARLHRIGVSSDLDNACALMLSKFILGERLEMEEHARFLLNSHSGNLVFVQNAIIPLVAMGDMRWAVAESEKMINEFHGSKESLDHAITHFTISLQFSKALSAIDAYNQLAINDGAPHSTVEQTGIRRSLEVAKSVGLTEEGMLERLETAVEAVRALGLEVRRQSRMVLHDGTFISQFYVETSADECAALNFAIADALVEKYDLVGDDVFSINCRPLSDFSDVMTRGG